MILTIELVPETAWYNNLRKVATKEQWDIIRKNAYKMAGYKCAVCGTSGLLHCHEIWEYDDHKHIQHLKGFTALCPMCHHVKHIGFAQVLAERGELDFDEVVNHFLRVNKCSLADFEKAESEAWDLWDKRSNHTWETDLGQYNYLKKGANDAK